MKVPLAGVACCQEEPNSEEARLPEVGHTECGANFGEAYVHRRKPKSGRS